MIKNYKRFNENNKYKSFQMGDGSILDIYWYDNGQKHFEKWTLNGRFHRKNEPAIKYWYKNGQKGFEKWFLNGKYHREDGPSMDFWTEDGEKLQDNQWYLNGKEYTREKWIEKLKEIGSNHYEEEKVKYEMEKYNL